MTVQTLATHDLVELCLYSRDEAAWVEFVRRSQPVIARVIVKSLRRRANPQVNLVDDLVQTTYLKLCTGNFRALRELKYEHENELFGFLKTVASNVVRDHFRAAYSQKRGRGMREDPVDEITDTPAVSGQSEQVDRTILVAQIKECLETQAADPTFARDNVIFWLYYKQGLSAKAISQLPAIGLTAKGVESALLRLTRIVREKLAGRSAKRADKGCSAASGS
jgi:RNA polymerase sigma-70 factor (ECF subfamily)